MYCYLCSLLTEALHLNEHEAAKWLAKDDLDSVKWLPADVIVVDKIRRMYESATANGFTSFAEA
jgi:8-oxo-dGTP diphosphatase